MRPIGAHIPAMALVLAIAGPATAQQDKAKEERLVLPSGLEAGLQEVISDQPGQGLTYRFRFVAPEFTGKEEFDSIMADLEYLCISYAIPRLPAIGPQPRQVVISLADHPAEFGVFDLDVTQVFEAYRIEDGTCIWEEF
ncbi:hypothetical protein SAMN05443432_104140 [Roseovarius litoreus]|uniref:Acetolactate synthase n=1 Tax=Roseovarius litoreus TaxID=1155722 RepID=A0A1M7FCC4_9RHOB|nr:DUF6497 family protein [Roseovarius litoreus]SHM01724.1 hypothetical protein SAMN05443432_104140 [Roseovarius litoreus]